MARTSGTPGVTTVRPVWMHPVVAGVVVLVATVAGVWVQPLLGWWLDSPIPVLFGQVVGWAADLPRPVGAGAGAVAGLVAAVAFCITVARDELVVEMAASGVTTRRRGESVHVAAQDLATVCLDGRELLLQSCDGRDLLRRRCDLDADRLAAAARGHGLPWSDVGDVHGDRFRPWVAGTGEIPATADALLRAREAVLESGQDERGEELRTEIARHGVVVRDRSGHQQWRTLAG